QRRGCLPGCELVQGERARVDGGLLRCRDTTRATGVRREVDCGEVAERERPVVLTPADARRLLGPKGTKLSDEELVRLLAEMYALAGIVIDSRIKAKRRQEH